MLATITISVDSINSDFEGQEHFFISTCTSSKNVRNPVNIFRILPIAQISRFSYA